MQMSCTTFFSFFWLLMQEKTSWFLLCVSYLRLGQFLFSKWRRAAQKRTKNKVPSGTPKRRGRARLIGPIAPGVGTKIGVPPLSRAQMYTSAYEGRQKMRPPAVCHLRPPRWKLGRKFLARNHPHGSDRFIFSGFFRPANVNAVRKLYV